MAPLSRHEAAQVGHEGNEGHLAQDGGFPRHVGAGDDQHLGVGVQGHIVGHKRTGGQQALDDRMASLLQVEPRLGSQPGTAVAVLGRQLGQGGQDIQNGQGPGHLLETGDLLPQAFP